MSSVDSNRRDMDPRLGPRYTSQPPRVSHYSRSYPLPPVSAVPGPSSEHIGNSYRSPISTSIVHPLHYSQENPKAPLAHIVHQQYQDPALISAPPPRYEFTAGLVRKGSAVDAESLSPVTNSRRTAKKIGIRREESQKEASHSQGNMQPTKEEGSGRPELAMEPSHPPQPIRYQPHPQAPYTAQHSSAHYYDPSRPPPQYPEARALEYQPRSYPVITPQPPPSRTMQISGLISPPERVTPARETDYHVPTSVLLAPAPAPVVVAPPSEPLLRMKMRQQPIAARACGFGERDRRVIDPPPILQMMMADEASDSKSKDNIYPTSVVHCTLWHAEDDVEDCVMPEAGERRQQRRLMGTLVSSPFVGKDENGVEGCFFTFPDLSCRTSGKYRLRFVLVVIDPGRMGPGDKARFESVVVSDVFQVFAAKDFPGMRPSTALTKRLKEQGCLISVKKGNDREGSRRSAAHSRADSLDPTEEEESDEAPRRTTTKDKKKPDKKKKKRT